jgi:hypothetical protein
LHWWRQSFRGSMWQEGIWYLELKECLTDEINVARHILRYICIHYTCV